MFALLAATGVALVLDPREIGGAPAWMKPAKFAASIGIYTLTLAWVFTYLPEWKKTRLAVSWVTTATLVIEIIIIDVQAWRGVTSHFNVGTPLDGVLFSIMGLAIVVQTFCGNRGGGGALAAALLRSRDGLGVAAGDDHQHHRRDVGRADGSADARTARRRTRRQPYDRHRRSHCGRARWRTGTPGDGMEPHAWRSPRGTLSWPPRPAADSAPLPRRRAARLARDGAGPAYLGCARRATSRSSGC